MLLKFENDLAVNLGTDIRRIAELIGVFQMIAGKQILPDYRYLPVRRWPPADPHVGRKVTVRPGNSIDVAAAEIDIDVVGKIEGGAKGKLIRRINVIQGRGKQRIVPRDAGIIHMEIEQTVATA